MMDPLAEKYYAWSPYSYVGNNPMRLIDPTGMHWLEVKDYEYAMSLSNSMADKISSNLIELDNLFNNLHNTSSSESVAEIESKMAGLCADINNLASGITELEQMCYAEQDFTYDFINGTNGQTKIRGDGVIVMSIGKDGNKDALGIHESSHGYDMLIGGGYPKTVTALYDTEIKAYGRQYSFSSLSMPTSDGGRIKQLGDINRTYISGIKDNNGIYTYARQAYHMSNNTTPWNNNAHRKLLRQLRREL